MIFGTNMIQETWTLLQEVSGEVTRVEGAPLGVPPCLVGPSELHLRAPSAYIYISIYPKTIEEHNRSGVPPPEASVATKNQSRPVPATCRRGGILL